MLVFLLPVLPWLSPGSVVDVGSWVEAVVGSVSELVRDAVSVGTCVEDSFVVVCLSRVDVGSDSDVDTSVEVDSVVGYSSKLVDTSVSEDVGTGV